MNESITGRFFRIDPEAPRICDSKREFHVKSGSRDGKPQDWVHIMAVASNWEDAGMIVEALNEKFGDKQ